MVASKCEEWSKFGTSLWYRKTLQTSLKSILNHPNNSHWQDVVTYCLMYLYLMLELEYVFFLTLLLSHRSSNLGGSLISLVKAYIILLAFQHSLSHCFLLWGILTHLELHMYFNHHQLITLGFRIGVYKIHDCDY